MRRDLRISRQLQRDNAARLKREVIEQAAEEQRTQDALARMKAKLENKAKDPTP